MQTKANLQMDLKDFTTMCPRLPAAGAAPIEATGGTH